MSMPHIHTRVCAQVHEPHIGWLRAHVYTRVHTHVRAYVEAHVYAQVRELAALFGTLDPAAGNRYSTII